MASITCRNGDAHTHASVAEVRACQLGSATSVRGCAYCKDGTCSRCQPANKSTAGKYRTGLAKALADARAAEVPEEPNWKWGATHNGNKAAPDKPKASADLRALEAKVPAGRYAVAGVAGHTIFYKIDKPTEGRWQGYTFINQQLSDEMKPVKIPNIRLGVLQQIVDQGVQECMERYGREIGECGHCGRTLTNEESRARGIGPICAGRMGW